ECGARGHQPAQWQRCEYGRPVQGRWSRRKRFDRSRLWYWRRHVGGRTRGRGQGAADRGSGRRYADGCTLAGKETIGNASVRDRVDDGVKPAVGDDGGERRSIVFLTSIWSWY